MRAAASSYDDAEGNEKGIELLQQATQRDPNFASAWGRLSDASITKHNISVAASGSTNCRVTRHSEPCNWTPIHRMQSLR